MKCMQRQFLRRSSRLQLWRSPLRWCALTAVTAGAAAAAVVVRQSRCELGAAGVVHGESCQRQRSADGAVDASASTDTGGSIAKLRLELR